MHGTVQRPNEGGRQAPLFHPALPARAAKWRASRRRNADPSARRETVLLLCVTSRAAISPSPALHYHARPAIMASDRHPRSRPLFDRSTSGTMPTLPSVAELLASSTPASDTIPAYHRPSNPLRPAPLELAFPRATPSTASYLIPPATLTASPRSSFVAVNHASHVRQVTVKAHARYQLLICNSPTGAGPSEQQQYQQPSQAPSPKFQDLVHSHTHAPTNGQRQDSAVSQQHFDVSKEGQYPAPSAELAVPLSNQSPDDRLQSHLTTSSSPLLPVRTSPYQPVPQPGAHTRGKSYSVGGHAIGPSRPHEHAADPMHNSTRTETAHKSIVPPTPDHPQNARQQRYNVRFAANHTPDNMLLSQKPRQDPPPAATPLAEAQSSPIEPPAAPAVESSVQGITSILRLQEDQSQAERHRGDRESSAEHCDACHSTWRRPLPDVQLYREEPSAGAAIDDDPARSCRNSWSNMAALLRQHGKKADDSLAEWKNQHHGHCWKHREAHQGSTPQQVGPSNHSQVGMGTRAESNGANKRKSEVPHDDDAQKARKITFDVTSRTAPPVRSYIP
jgi:hypothetical protein